jgi:hypothetical protein
MCRRPLATFAAADQHRNYWNIFYCRTALLLSLPVTGTGELAEQIFNTASIHGNLCIALSITEIHTPDGKITLGLDLLIASVRNSEKQGEKTTRKDNV